MKGYSEVELSYEEIDVFLSIAERIGGGFLPIFEKETAILITILNKEQSIECRENYSKSKMKGLFVLFNFIIPKMIYEIFEMVSVDERSLKQLESEFISMLNEFLFRHIQPKSRAVN